MTEQAAEDRGPATISLGRFDPLQLPIILDVLHEHGIFAMTKSPLDKPEGAPYPVFQGDREILLVEAGRADEARELIATEVKTIGDEMAEGLAAEDAGPGAEGLAPFGWLEPEVARELIAQLRTVEIVAAPEYPLDAPPPPYARADGRVRVHVEEMFFDEAAEMLENEVRDSLTARGVAFTEPLREEDS